jgi:large exoprotein involved in heme utilization and adhesion
VAPITIQGSLLQVPDGATLAIVGGDVGIDSAAAVMASGGRVQIASLASAGEAVLDPAGNLDVGSFTALGRIDISTSFVGSSDFSGLPGGSVSIVGGQLAMDGGSIIVDTAGAVEGLQPGIRIQATDDVLVGNASFIGVTTFGDGRVGDIDVSGRSVSLTGGSVILTQTFGAGQGGDIRVTAAETLSVSGRDLFGNASDISSFTSSIGQGGRITLSAPNVSLDDGGSIRTLTFAEGAGGDIRVEAGRFSLINDSQILSGAAFTGLGGDIMVTGDAIGLLGGPATRIASSATPASEVGAPPDVIRTGDILLTGRTIEITGGAQVQSGNLLQDTGTVTLEARESVSLSAGSRVSNQAFEAPGGTVRIVTPTLEVNDAIIDTGTLGIGNAGDVFIDAARVNLTNGGKVVSSAQMFSGGNGGNVAVSATGSVTISGASATGLATTDFITDARSGIYSEAQEFSVGAAGGISISTPTFTLADGATVSVRTAGDGPGGNIAVTAQEAIIRQEGVVSATSSGLGNAGNIAFVIGDLLRLDGGMITTAAAQADGGNISITSTGTVLHLTGGRITTSVRSGFGAGGNITIGSVGHPIEFVVLNDSAIRADAFGGPGGNVDIFAGTFLSTDSIVSASSALGVQGTISIQAGVTEISGTVGQLPEATSQAAELLRAACATRMAGGQSSSLVVSGREGLPAEPGGMLASSLVAEGAASTERGESPARVPLWAFEPRCLR